MDMGGHDMGGAADGTPMCKISMLLNWYSIDACFLSDKWHIRSKAGFAGTLIGVFLITALIEGVRRAHREYDRRLIAGFVASKQPISGSVESLSKGDSPLVNTPNLLVIRSTWTQHAIRSIFYGTQYMAAFMVMLLGMYFNAAILIAIFLGGTAGYLVFARDTLVSQVDSGSGCCC